MSLRSRAIATFAATLDGVFPRGGVVCYHGVVAAGAMPVPSPEMHIAADTLHAQLDFLQRRYDVLPLLEFLQRVAAARSIDGCVAITFDDAYAGVGEFAVPSLASMNLPATIFVTTDAADRGGVFWWDAIEDLGRNATPDVWTKRLVEAGIDAPISLDGSAIDSVRAYVLAKRKGRLPAPSDAWAPISPHLRSMTFAELRAIDPSARITFGCHTLSHPALPTLDEADREREIAGAYARISKELSNVVPVIAYPYGLFDDATAETTRRVGLTHGVTTERRAVLAGDDSFAIPRLVLSEQWSTASIRFRLNRGVARLAAGSRRSRP